MSDPAVARETLDTAVDSFNEVGHGIPTREPEIAPYADWKTQLSKGCRLLAAVEEIDGVGYYTTVVELCFGIIGRSLEAFAIVGGQCLVWSIVPASEALEPGFGGFRFDVAEAVRKRRRSAFQLTKNPLDSILISVPIYLKSEAGSLERGLEVLSAIDEEFGGLGVVFLPEFAKEEFGEGGRGRRNETDVKQVVCLWVSGVRKSSGLAQPIRMALPF